MPIKQLVTLIRTICIANTTAAAWAVKKEQLFTAYREGGDGEYVHSDLLASPRDVLYVVIPDFSVVHWSLWWHSVQQVTGSVLQYQRYNRFGEGWLEVPHIPKFNLFKP